jgi:hypothetical protein
VPKSLKSYPEGLRPYIFHGVDFKWQDGEDQAYAECPFCGDGRDKFNVEASTGKWNCYVCQMGGLPISFLNKFWDICNQNTSDYTELAEHRGIHPDTLMFWGVSKSELGDWWVVPSYNSSRRIAQLYKYVAWAQKPLLLGCPIAQEEMKHCVFGVDLFDEEKPEVYLCEGPWDAMILWERLREARTGPEGLVLTSNNDRSLLAEASVLGIPGCGTFNAEWCKLFSDKVVYLLFDNDYPRKHPQSGKELPPAGYNGVRRTATILRGARKPPAEIHYLRWGEGGYTEELPSGYDVRDFLLGAQFNG